MVNAALKSLLLRQPLRLPGSRSRMAAIFFMVWGSAPLLPLPCSPTFGWCTGFWLWQPAGLRRANVPDRHTKIWRRQLCCLADVMKTISGAAARWRHHLCQEHWWKMMQIQAPSPRWTRWRKCIRQAGKKCNEEGLALGQQPLFLFIFACAETNLLRVTAVKWAVSLWRIQGMMQKAKVTVNVWLIWPSQHGLLSRVCGCASNQAVRRLSLLHPLFSFGLFDKRLPCLCEAREAVHLRASLSQQTDL